MRVKTKTLAIKKFHRSDLNQGIRKPGKHIFYRLEMPYLDALRQVDALKEKIMSSNSAKFVKVRNIVHPDDDLEFLFLYNTIFIAAPDPSRTINQEEAQSFPAERTFVATLWQAMAGFIYLTVEKDPLGSGDMVGAVAGIGVLPKYRGRKIGLNLLMHAISFFKDKNVEKLVCEVYQENIPSLRMFQGLGMQIVGQMILEDVQPTISNGDKDEI